jgi:hypothetical protein
VLIMIGKVHNAFGSVVDVFVGLIQVRTTAHGFRTLTKIATRDVTGPLQEGVL